MNLREKIVDLRKKKNMSQEEPAEKCGVTRQTISNWKNGKSYPDIEMSLLFFRKVLKNLNI